MTSPSPCAAPADTDAPRQAPRVRVIAIAAMAENRVIGAANTLPWHLPEDLKWFRECTRGRTLLMGRKTFASIGRPLPRRRTLVLTRRAEPIDGVELVHSVEEALARAAESGDGQLWVCGGAEVYALTLPLWDELRLTRVKRTVEGDAVFPAFEDRFALESVIRETEAMRIEILRPAGGMLKDEPFANSFRNQSN